MIALEILELIISSLNSKSGKVYNQPCVKQLLLVPLKILEHNLVEQLNKRINLYYN